MAEGNDLQIGDIAPDFTVNDSNGNNDGNFNPGETVSVSFAIDNLSNQQINNLSLEIGLSLWEAYSKKALQFCEKSDIPIFYCSFESLLESPNLTCTPLFKFLEKKLNKNIINKFIDKSISKNNQGEEYPQSESITMLETTIKSLILK